MGIISTIGRRHWKVRLLIWSIYAALTLGALTMLYPFGLMIAGSTKSGADVSELTLVPGFLHDESALWRKFVEANLNESFTTLKFTYDEMPHAWDDIREPRDGGAAHELVDDWESFCREGIVPDYSWQLGQVYAPRSRGVIPANLRAFKRRLEDEYGGDIEKCNAALQTRFEGWNAVFYLPNVPLYRRQAVRDRPLDRAFNEFKRYFPVGRRSYISMEKFYRRVYLRTRYQGDIADYNRSHATHRGAWNEIPVPQRITERTGLTAAERRDWEDFVRTVVNIVWVRVAPTSEYAAFLKVKYGGDLQLLNRRYGTTYQSWGQVQVPQNVPHSGMELSDLTNFIEEGIKDPESGKVHRAPLDSLRLVSVEQRFRARLKAKYGTLQRLREATGYAAATWASIPLPQEAIHWRFFRSHKRQIRKEFIVRNFLTVFDVVLLHGRAVFNTVVYCLLAILAALTVNPLAAYGLSRFKPPGQYKLLMFLMLTMAFPPMVATIPVFLMLRDFHLLNSFWALILPTLANGYSIFLLKGFFDSLPQELYESAQLDGASELRIFMQITMSLSKPILAVIALNTFRMAYANFMMALLVCQDSRMWTIMPWLYQLQQRSGEGVVFASLLVAAVPTFLVFAFCQNVIMRGIVVPVEK